MTRKYFGTDGIRGKANTAPMTAEIALKVAMATASLFRPESTKHRHRPRVVIGKDTRLSGYLLEPALTAGFIAMGMDVTLLGPLPTPAVAQLTKSLRADLGVMISASHNPYQDNGIKLFGPDGYKLSDTLEAQIEERMDAPLESYLVGAEDLGRASRLDDAVGRYVEYVKSTFPTGLRLDGLKIVLDCAHGAAYKVAPAILWELGADVITIANQPDGRNINHHCGATHPSLMQEAVVMHGADLGIALDGDADRLIMADEKGQKIDGDQLMAMIARTWQQKKCLKGNGIVATVMSNLGFERYIEGLGLAFHRAAVGDRYVVEQMREKGCNIGGEQSGHIVLADYGPTGDAMIAALQILAALQQQSEKISKACRLFTPVPQILQNVKVVDIGVLSSAPVTKAIAHAENQLKGKGRLLVRKSGTEPLIRVMAEGDDEKLVQQLVADIVASLAAA
jgi:phosphoglucosamine mutase